MDDIVRNNGSLTEQSIHCPAFILEITSRDPYPPSASTMIEPVIDLGRFYWMILATSDEVIENLNLSGEIRTFRIDLHLEIR